MVDLMFDKNSENLKDRKFLYSGNKVQIKHCCLNDSSHSIYTLFTGKCRYSD